MAVLLVTMAYVAAGLSLLVGTPARRPSTGDRMLGLGALIACALLLLSSPGRMLVGAVLLTALAWVVYRVARRTR